MMWVRLPPGLPNLGDDMSDDLPNEDKYLMLLKMQRIEYVKKHGVDPPGYAEAEAKALAMREAAKSKQGT